MKQRSISKVYIKVAILICMMSFVLISISVYKDKEQWKDGEMIRHIFTKKVEQHRPLINKYAKDYQVDEHTDVLLAMMMQESGGRGSDPMQSSESLCGEVGCIEDVEESIEQGVRYFAKSLQAADGDVELAVQAYNFGLGFVNYVNDQEGSFNQDIAIQFSKEMYENAEDQSIYTCLREEAKQFDACYGDIYYARDVMAHKNEFAIKE